VVVSFDKGCPGGEVWAIIEGMDPNFAAGRAGHSREVQARNYKKYDAIRAQYLADKHLPKL